MFGDAASSPGPLLRPTRMLSPTRGGFSAESEQTDSSSIDNATDQGSDDSHITPSHVGRSEGGLPRTIPLAGTPDRAASPTKRPSPTLNISATLGRANSFAGTGASGARRIAPLSASTTGTRYGAALMGELRSTNTGSPVRQWGGGTPQCPRCTKNVYFAEQVKAIGKTWHKACLRCSECGTSLDSSRLTERDGNPLCHRCYNKVRSFYRLETEPSVGAYSPGCSCTAQLVVGTPFWEKQAVEARVSHRDHPDDRVLYGVVVCCTDGMDVCSLPSGYCYDY